eukprot:4055881-Lingulodinium_polyedra.AAC.1
MKIWQSPWQRRTWCYKHVCPRTTARPQTDAGDRCGARNGGSGVGCNGGNRGRYGEHADRRARGRA